MSENEWVQQRENLINRRQDECDDRKLPKILKVPVKSGHRSGVVALRTTLDDLFRESLPSWLPVESLLKSPESFGGSIRFAPTHAYVQPCPMPPPRRVRFQ